MAVDFGDAGLLAALASRKAALDHGIEALKDAARRDCQAEMAGTFAAFLSAHPCVLAVGWRQGTPGWRDGDECVFEVGFPRLFLSKALLGTPNPDDGDDPFEDSDESLEGERARLEASLEGGDDVWGWGSPEQRAKDRERRKADSRARIARIDAAVASAGGLEAYRVVVRDFGRLRTFLRGIRPDLMAMAYGDPVEVRYGRGGVEVLDFEGL